VFKLPPRSNADDPIRARAAGRFPTGLLVVGLGVLFVLGVAGFALFRATRPPEEPPPEPFENSLGMKLVLLKEGTFKMGSPDDEPGRNADEGPVHDVTIRGPFFMSATEVTHQQFAQVMTVAPSQSVKYASHAANLPVESVTYEQAREFCRKLTEKEKKEKWARKGWEYRLPTEAEWEYACRAGTDTPYAFGRTLTHHSKDPKRGQARYLPTGDPAEAPLEGGLTTLPERAYIIPAPVGSYPPNAWGLYDVHGNVGEWCSDWYGPYRAEPQDNPTGAESGVKRVVRGGSFKDPASACRSAARRAVEPGYKGVSRDDPTNGAVGFRVVYAPK
jgi:formylglycine-generating enzyme required for sulfatase activity